ncbi:MAG: hypothetical protein JXR95_16800 [Deltaproteobacteria bacterium]|nr:hypothetical protein [Deltaproteobacteria bacterium]
MRKFSYLYVAVIGFSILILGCDPDSSEKFNNTNNNTNSNTNATDCSDPDGDDDLDGIPNRVEGCGSEVRDSDGDGWYDFNDTDSDNDGVSDRVEAGDYPEFPIDSDGDGDPDYRDKDSDNDGLNDGEEDQNGDGKIGKCVDKCPVGNECHESQTCVNGECVLKFNLLCSMGETDPTNPDTDGDGIPDGQEGSRICSQQSEDNPMGRKPVQFVNHSGDYYRLATEESAVVYEASLSDSSAGGIMNIDMDWVGAQIAGFVVHRNPPGASITTDVYEISSRITSALGVGSVVRSSGISGMSHDEFPLITNIAVQIVTPDSITVTEARKRVAAAMLDIQPGDITSTGTDYGTSGTNFMVEFMLEKRPPTSGDDDAIIMMGGVALFDDYVNQEHQSGFLLDDLSNGSGIAQFDASYEDECEGYYYTPTLKADIIWVIDESGSTGDERQKIADSTVMFFNNAVNAGLDFRMGVIDMTLCTMDMFGTCNGYEPDGRFCTGDEQTGDEWLLPSQSSEFAACAYKPSGDYEADSSSEYGLQQAQRSVARHYNDIRPDAVLVVIFETDENDQEAADEDCDGPYNDPSVLSCLEGLPSGSYSYLKNNLLQRNIDDGPGGVAHAILGYPDSCLTANGGTAPDPGTGYYELAMATGGQIGSVCAPDFMTTMNMILDSIVAKASPLILAHFPISTSIAVALENTPLERSRTLGFDYHSSTNSIVLYGQNFEPNSINELVVSYRRWVTGVAPVD